MFPVERGKWSDEQGLVELDKADFKLPAENWQWEDEWKVMAS